MLKYLADSVFGCVLYLYLDLRISTCGACYPRHQTLQKLQVMYQQDLSFERKDAKKFSRFRD